MWTSYSLLIGGSITKDTFPLPHSLGGGDEPAELPVALLQLLQSTGLSSRLQPNHHTLAFLESPLGQLDSLRNLRCYAQVLEEPLNRVKKKEDQYIKKNKF